MELLTMKERKAVTKALAGQYRKATKRAKGRVLGQFVKATGYVRCYARRLLHCIPHKALRLTETANRESRSSTGMIFKVLCWNG